MANLKQECLNLRYLLEESNQAKALLQEALDKSAELVAHLENEVREQAKRANNNYDWWQEEKLVVKDLRKQLAEVQGQAGLIAKLTGDRNNLQSRLDQCLGWIAKASNKGPFDIESPLQAIRFTTGAADG